MFARSVVVALATALLLSFTALRAEETAKTGSVSGVIKDVKGEPAAGVEVRLFNPMNRSERQPVKQQSDSAAKEKKKDSRPAPVATATTDKDGKFEMKDVPAGKYVLLARVKDVGAARGEVEVAAGKDVSVSLQLKERKSDKKQEKPAAQ